MADYKFCSKCAKRHHESKFKFNPKAFRHGNVCSSCRHSPSLAAQAKRQAHEELQKGQEQIGEIQKRIKLAGNNATAGNCRKLQISLGVFRRNTGIGITVKEWDALMEAQRGVCGICGHPEIDSKRLAIDHDHATMRIRGLLCSACNTGLGQLGDGRHLLLAALKYVETPPADKAIYGRSLADVYKIDPIEEGYKDLLIAIFSVPADMALVA